MLTEPDKIEQLSFEIITRELKRDITGPAAPLVKRIIHTTADFEYAEITEILGGAIERGMGAIRSGCRIYCDTKMIQAGVNKERLGRYGSEIYTCVSDDDVIREAAARGVTRSIVGIEKAARDRNTKIFAIGNAPTALMTLKELIDKGETSPELVIGVPVGFVGAAESKEAIRDAGAPCIITRGRKGGSTVAVAIVNALIYMIK